MGTPRVRARLRKQFLKGRIAEGFFPITFKSHLQTFIEDSMLHGHLIPSLILLTSGFLTAQKKYSQVLNVRSLSIHSCLAQNITESRTQVPVFLCFAPSLFLLYFRHGSSKRILIVSAHNNKLSPVNASALGFKAPLVKICHVSPRILNCSIPLIVWLVFSAE